MKKALAISLLLLFSMRPALAVGQVLYYQLNIDYVIEKYCVNKEAPKLECNGKCFLAKKMNLQEKEQANENEVPQMILAEAFFPLYFESFKSHKITKPFIGVIKSNWGGNQFSDDIYMPILGPPPRLS